LTGTTASPAESGNLPAEPNGFVGRERDLADLAVLLDDVRLLTLAGPGGVGKTRLAIRMARQLAGSFSGGAWLVELADVAEPDLLAVSVAGTLAVRQEPDRPVADTLCDVLRPRQLLLVLDTCEHLIDAVASLARRLLADCPSLRILATSREPLRLPGETVWRVPPLELPPDVAPGARPAEIAEHEAVRLFCERAIAVRPGFVLDAENTAAVSRVCRTLDGMPLAIELAAARLRALSAAQVADRLADRFRLLASGDRTAPPRQQTLRAAVDWSHDLLTEPEQVLLRRLTVFSGWNLEAAEHVCAGDGIRADQVLSLLVALIDKSLVTLDGDPDGVPRYRLLDTIRDYARERLAASGEHRVVRLRHLDYMLARADLLFSSSFVRGQLTWAEQVATYRFHAADMPNYRIALATALEYGRAEQGLRICSALRARWIVYGDVAEGTTWFERFLKLDGDVGPQLRARALALSAELAFEQQDYAMAAAHASQALDICTASGVPGAAAPLRMLGLVALRSGRAEDALAGVQSAIAAAGADGDEWEEGLALVSKATVLARLGRLDEAQQAFEAALDLLAGNNGWGIARARYGSGMLAMSRGDNDLAFEQFTGALQMFSELDARPEMAGCLAGIGRVQLAAGDLAGAASSLASSLRLSVAAGQRLGIARGVDAVAGLAAASGDQQTAARLAGAAGRLRDAADQVRTAAGQACLDRVLASAQRAMGAGNAARLLADGAALSQDEAVSLALQACAPYRADLAADAHPTGDAVTARSARPAGAGRQDGPGGAARQGQQTLTAREQEIALLIARGLSNRAIADELVISPATAARHVANILGKLGFSSRAQVAAWAVQRSHM
jgi:predicted ATPase/DNA-binding CsgD family transcriptional regulator